MLGLETNRPPRAHNKDRCDRKPARVLIEEVVPTLFDTTRTTRSILGALHSRSEFASKKNAVGWLRHESLTANRAPAPRTSGHYARATKIREQAAAHADR